jgi:hypothetical protein
MSPDNTIKSGPSATTSSSAPRKNDAPPPDKSAASLSDSEYLEQQAQAAKDAIARVWADVSGGLGKSADPRQWTKSHPWISLASATVAGFVAASTMVPSKEEQALKKLAAIERALRGGQREDKPAANGDDHKSDGKTGIVGNLLKQAITAAQPIVMSMLAGQFGGGQPPADGQQSQGQPESNPQQAGPEYGNPRS